MYSGYMLPEILHGCPFPPQPCFNIWSCIKHCVI